METTDEIAAAINLIDVKKENLRKSFLHLQSQSPSSFNFTLKWADLDSYFTTLRSSLQYKLHLLQTPNPFPDTTTVLARPELKSFCQNSDGLGLRQFISHTPNGISLLAELPDAYRCAPDAAAMVLDAVAGFYSGNASGIKSRRSIKNSCEIMLYGLMRVKPDVTVELMEKAMAVAVALQCNQERLSSGRVEETRDYAYGFLLLVGAYGLRDGFSMDELIDCFVIVGRQRLIVDLCREIVPANKINDLIQKLINKDMHVTAVTYSMEFGKSEEFPAVRLLEEQKLMCMKNVEKIFKNGEADNDVMVKEVLTTLKLIMKCIDEYHLKSECPKDTMFALVKKLENEMRARKQVPVCKEKQLPKKQKLNNFLQAADVPTTMFALVKKLENEMRARKQVPVCKEKQLPKKQKLNNFLQAADVPTTIENVMAPDSVLPSQVGQYPSAEPMKPGGSKPASKQNPEAKIPKDSTCFHCGVTTGKGTALSTSNK